MSSRNFSKMSELVSTRSKTAQEASKSKPLCSTPSDRPLSQSAKKKRAAGATKETDLKAKEEEYRRLNEELQAKTASLLKEADSFIMRDTEGLFEHVSPSRGHPSATTGSPAMHSGGGAPQRGGTGHGKKGNPPRAMSAAGRQRGDTSEQIRALERPRTTSHERTVVKAVHKTVPSKPPRSVKSQVGRVPALDHVGGATQDEVGLGTELDNIAGLLSAPDRDIHSQTHLSGIESGTVPSFPLSDHPDVFATSSLHVSQGKPLHDDIVPEVAEELGPESLIRFLKAKLHVMQEEMDRMNAEAKEKDKLLQEAQLKVSELTSEQGRWRKTQQGLQSQLDRQRQLAEELKHSNDHLEGQISSLKKELEAKDKAQKQTTANQSVIEVRLNRALEEVEKNKAALQRARAESKDLSEQERRRMEKTVADNKRLEKQKGELMTAFKKQLKLIDILKRQKMHLEAAKLLSFSEEEFVKALDWELP